MDHNSESVTHVSGQFPSTRRSLVMRAGSPGSPQTRAALGDLCSAYCYRFEPADTLTADRLFDRAWALTLLEKVLDLPATANRRPITTGG